MGCGEEGSPGVYAEVYKFKKWLQKHMAEGANGTFITEDYFIRTGTSTKQKLGKFGIETSEIPNSRQFTHLKIFSFFLNAFSIIPSCFLLRVDPSVSRNQLRLQATFYLSSTRTCYSNKYLNYFYNFFCQAQG